MSCRGDGGGSVRSAAEAQVGRIQGLVKPSPEQLSLFKALWVGIAQHQDLGAQPLW